MTISQFEKQLKVWRREDRDTYNNIMMLADTSDVLTSRGEITKDKRNKSKVDRFLSRYQNEIGSFSSFIKNAKKRRKDAIEEYAQAIMKEDSTVDVIEAYAKASNALGKNAKEYAQKMRNINELIHDLFERSMNSNEARSMLDYSKTLTLEEQKEYLQRKLEEVTPKIKGRYTT